MTGFPTPVNFLALKWQIISILSLLSTSVSPLQKTLRSFIPLPQTFVFPIKFPTPVNFLALKWQIISILSLLSTSVSPLQKTLRSFIPLPQTFVFPIKCGISINILFVSLVFLYIFYSFCALSAQKLLKYTVTKLNGRCMEEQPENLLLHSR